MSNRPPFAKRRVAAARSVLDAIAVAGAVWMAVAGAGCSGAAGQPGSGGATHVGGSGGTTGAGGADALDSATHTGGTAVVAKDGGAVASGGVAGPGAMSGGAGGGLAAGTGGAGDVSPQDGGADASGSVADGAVAAAPGAPTGLLCELLKQPDEAAITDATPEFAWIVNAAGANQRQTAYRILVASSAANLDANTGDLWDSQKVTSGASINVSYAGKALTGGASYLWKVQTWDASDQVSPWSPTQKFVMAANLGAYSTREQAQTQERLAPVKVTAVASGHYFVDFGRAAFGWVELTLNAPASSNIGVALGEKAKGQAVDSAPGSSIRYASVQLAVQPGQRTYRVNTPRNGANTSSPAIALPAALGVVMPFRYVELTNCPVELTAEMIRQVAVHYPADGTASAFASSNTTLNQVMDLSRYSIIAPTFTGIYIDGDRERTPYEGDAYIQMLGHYALDREFALQRYSHEYLLSHPTWPTEWKQHSVMMAWTDWMYTGNTDSLAQFYSTLTKEKTLESHVNGDGLLNTNGLRDLVDWPEGERDGFVLTDVNTVVNAFWYRNLLQMVDIATVLGKTSEATRYQEMATKALASFNAKLFNTSSGVYADGAGSSHTSLHGNMFPLAFGMVPDDRKAKVVSFVKGKGMACSVYGAQYLLEGLYRAGEPDAAVALMTSTTDRSWTNMIRLGATMTLEAWDAKYKPNLDWNHAWGAAPANIVPRYLIGVQPLEPGFAKARIQPQLGSLTHAEGTVPTIRGPVRVVLDHAAGQPYTMNVTIPANMTANVAVPVLAPACVPTLDGVAAKVTTREGLSWIDSVGSGTHLLRCP